MFCLKLSIIGEDNIIFSLSSTPVSEDRDNSHDDGEAIRGWQCKGQSGKPNLTKEEHIKLESLFSDGYTSKVK